MEFGAKMMEILSEGLEDIGQEFGRLGVQGEAELASALFTGNGYVPYGRGQDSAGGVHGMEGLHEGKEEIQQENDGRSM